MKSFAGSLKVGLAQFREVESFASLGCDIDPVTQQLLDRGYRLTELFIQSKFDNFSLDASLLSIFSGSSGFFDSFEVKNIANVFSFMLENLLENLWYPFFNFLNSADNSYLTEVNNMLSFYTRFIAVNKDKIKL
jgi:F0F1-type ATP synthase alpha subunit